MLRFARYPAMSLFLVAVLLTGASPAVAASSWTVVATPNPGTANSINGLVAFSPTEVWGVGNASSQSYTGCHGRTLTARWNGTAFVEVASLEEAAGVRYYQTGNYAGQAKPGSPMLVRYADDCVPRTLREVPV